MSDKCVKLFISICLIAICTVVVVSSDTRTKPQDAWIWPGLKKVGIRLTFSDRVDWSDLWSLRGRSGFYTVGKLCVRGSFILYDHPLFRADSEDDYEIFSGSIRCMMLAETTKSIQLIGSMGSMNGPSITFFEKANFGSEAYPTAVNVGNNFFENMHSARSLIIVGKVPWTIQLTSGERYCIRPDFDSAESRPICLVRDLAILLEIENGTTVLERATQGCKEDIGQESIYKVQDCDYWGRPPFKQARQRAIAKLDELKGRSGNGGGDKNVCSDPENSKKLFQMYRAVISDRLESDLIVGWPKIGQNAWKLELLDSIFELTTTITTPANIPTMFLGHVRELFIDRLATELAKPDSNETVPLTEREYRNLLSLTDGCVETAKVEFNEPGLQEQFQIPWDSIQTIEDLGGKIDPEFSRKPERDIVTEVVWIVGHLIGYTCHKKYMLMNSYWTLFFKGFKEICMDPVASEWNNPTTGLSIIFAGIDYEQEYTKIAYLASVAKGIANNLEPLKRPM